MRIRTYLCVAVIACCAVGAEADVCVCDWNLLHFSASVSTDTTRVDAYKLVLSDIDPDILIVEEIADLGAVNYLRDQILNAAGGPGGSVGTPEHYTAASFTNTPSNIDLAMFYRDDRFEEITGSYISISTSPRETPRWRLRPVAAATDATDLYIYAMHLHSTDQASRAAQTQIVRNNANAFPTGTHFVYAGDFNVDSSGEASYINLVGFAADNDGQAFDPINSAGNWGGNSSFAAIHTQSPYDNNSGAPGDAIGGGLDDRFDFMLISAALEDSVGFDYVSGTYHAFGNDGLHYNDDINDPPVIPEGAAIADALHSASDHLPVVMNLTDPQTLPEISLTPAGIVNFPLALVGGTSTADLTVTNTATPPTDPLEYSFDPLPGFQVPVGTFFEPAGGGGLTHALGLDTSTSGNKIGVLQINNNSGNASPVKTIVLSGAVLDHAIPSVTPTNQTTAGMIEFSTAGDEIVDETARVYNADYDEFLSAALEVTAANVINNASGRFSVVGFAPATGITDFADFTVRFDGVGAAPGAYTADVVFSTADDSSLSGTMPLADITFSLSAEVPSSGPLLGDFNVNGTVEPGDIPGMVALLLDPDGASPEDKAIGDMNQDTINNAADLALFVEALLQ